MTEHPITPAEPTSAEVVVVDDEENLARMFARAIEDAGHGCAFTTSPRQALDWIMHGHVKVLVSDIVMPEMSGLELMSRAMEIRPRLRVVLVTGHSNLHVAIEAMKAGASDFVCKPFDLHSFSRRIAGITEMLTANEEEGGEQDARISAPDTRHCPDLPGYRVIRRIGSGAMGSVFQARQEVLHRLVAVKVIRPSALGTPAGIKRFLTEAKATASLNHANIIQVHDLVEQQGNLFLIMEYFPSRSLTDVVTVVGGLPWQKALLVTTQLAQALQHASERGVVHRDVKPDNVLVGKGWRCKLTDFGLAKQRTLIADTESETVPTRIGMVLGTPHFMSPEQAVGSPDVDVRADIYALGLTLYFMIEGRPPYSGTVPEIIAAQLEQPLPPIRGNKVPAVLAEILDRMARKEPLERFQTPRDVLRALVPLA